MPTTRQVRTVDVLALSRRDPQAATWAYALNDRAQGGVDLDGAPLSLREDEFVAAVSRWSPQTQMQFAGILVMRFKSLPCSKLSEWCDLCGHIRAPYSEIRKETRADLSGSWFQVSGFRCQKPLIR